MAAALSKDWQEYPRLAASATRAEQFSIWAMRLWWRGFPELDAIWPDFVHGFRVCGVLPAIESCHRFCSIALAASGHGCGIGCLHCPQIAPREERLLEALGAANGGNHDLVENLLRNSVPASAARLMAPHAVHFARALNDAGLLWPQRAVPHDANSLSSADAAAPMFSQRFH